MNSSSDNDFILKNGKTYNKTCSITCNLVISLFRKNCTVSMLDKLIRRERLSRYFCESSSSFVYSDKTK
jgi:hypothetical protein